MADRGKAISRFQPVLRPKLTRELSGGMNAHQHSGWRMHEYAGEDLKPEFSLKPVARD